MLLTKTQIKHADDIQTEDVEIPEWGGSVRVRSMTGAERDAFEAGSLLPASGKKQTREVSLINMRARLVACSVIDEQGALMFSVEDVIWLGEKSGAALDRIADVAKRLSHLTSDDVEGLVKNSVSGQSEDSGSN